MGVSPVFCCFNNQQPKCVTATGLVASILAFAFLTWGVADLEFKRDGVKAIYIIAYILVIVILLTFIFLFILLSMQKSNSYRTMMNLGRLICLLVLVFTGIAFIFLLIAWIILLVDYSKLHSFLKDLRNGEVADDEDPDDYDWAEPLDDIDIEAKIIGHEWAAVIVPGIIGLLALILIALIANALYKMFFDTYTSGTQYPVTTGYNQNSASPLPNMTQPGLFPNNNGPVPPMGNNFNSQVEIRQN
jgi:heme/copper-type cytochrome/quinol oxidase subunit 2